MKVYGLISDGGDGSASLQSIRTEEEVDKILNDDEQAEWYGLNEGGPAVELTLPDGTDLEAMGIHFWD